MFSSQDVELVAALREKVVARLAHPFTDFCELVADQPAAPFSQLPGDEYPVDISGMGMDTTVLGSAVRHARVCAVSVGLCAPLVPITEVPRMPRFGTSCEKFPGYHKVSSIE